MSIYIMSADDDGGKAHAVEQKIRHAIPGLVHIGSLDAIADAISRSAGPIYLLSVAPAQDRGNFSRLLEMAATYRDRVFFILISDEISVADYKALVRTGSADWVSVGAGPQEILDIIAKPRRRGAAELPSGGAAQAKPVAVSFVPSAGGVGNTTLAVEVAVHLKRSKATRDRNICIVDLDFQSSHVCDYLDIDPRLQIQEISSNPDRLDAQLFEIFISRHSSGLHVFAAPRSKFNFCDLNVAALDAFFNMTSLRYDLILIDLPLTWLPWTPQIIFASDGVIVTGMNTIPGLRQTVETLAAVRETAPASSHIAVAVNRCQRRLIGGIARRQHVETVLGRERVFYVGDAPTALESINTGRPMALSKTGGAIGKDVAAIAAFCAELKSSRVVSA
jgi:pilus assembly protein CpaE